MQKTLSTLKSLILAFVLTAGLSYVLAWTGPGATPPGGNVEPPINVSNTTQFKAAGLSLGGDGWSLSDFCIVNTDGVKQKCLSAAGAGSATGGGSMLSGFPDAVACPSTSTDAFTIYYLDFKNGASDIRYRNDEGGYYIFNSAGAFVNSYGVPQACEGKSVSQLQQFYFTGGGTVSPVAGVSKIIAGSGVTVTPTGGTGDVTVSASGGSGSAVSGFPNEIACPGPQPSGGYGSNHKLIYRLSGATSTHVAYSLPFNHIMAAGGSSGLSSTPQHETVVFSRSNRTLVNRAGNANFCPLGSNIDTLTASGL